MKNTNLGILILRCSVGVLMLLHGIAKFKGITGIEGMLAAKGLPSVLAYGVYIGEVVAPLLIIIGYRTRFAALVFVLNCVTATLLAHSQELFKLSPMGGWALELLGLYTFGALALFFTGGGKYSLSSNSSWD